MCDKYDCSCDCNSNNAGVYVDMARVKNESLWERRKINWKIHFLAWTVLALAIYGKITGQRLFGFDAFAVSFGAIIIYLIYAMHWIGAFVSDERDKDWIDFYLRQAAVCLKGDTEWDKKKKEIGFKAHCDRLCSDKNFHIVFTQLLITIIMLIIALILIWNP